MLFGWIRVVFDCRGWRRCRYRCCHTCRCCCGRRIEYYLLRATARHRRQQRQHRLRYRQSSREGSQRQYHAVGFVLVRYFGIIVSRTELEVHAVEAKRDSSGGSDGRSRIRWQWQCHRLSRLWSHKGWHRGWLLFSYFVIDIDIVVVVVVSVVVFFIWWTKLWEDGTVQYCTYLSVGCASFFSLTNNYMGCVRFFAEADCLVISLDNTFHIFWRERRKKSTEACLTTSSLYQYTCFYVCTVISRW